MTEQIPPEPLELAHRIADCFRSFDAVQAVALNESASFGEPSSGPDLDLYVFTTEPIVLRDRNGASQQESAQDERQLCDEWLDLETGVAIDLTYWDPTWIEKQFASVLERHEPSLGYTTVFWGTILKAHILYDKNGWLAALKTRCIRPYPEELRNQIIARNHAVLRGPVPSYFDQIEKDVQRNDPVGLQNRITVLLASYFDVLFGLNRIPHPGEKHLLANAAQLDKQPDEMQTDILTLLQSCREPGEDILRVLQRLLDRLDALLVQEGFDPKSSLPVG